MAFLAPTGLAALVLAVAAGPSSAHPTSSSATKVTALSVAPHSLSHAGGSVQLHATVKHASKCTVSSSPHLAGLPTTRSCSSGHLSLSLHVGANASSSLRHITLTVKAVKHSHHASRSAALMQAGASTTSTPPMGATPTSTTPTSTTPTSTTPTSTTPTSTTPTSTTPTSTTPTPTPISSTATADAPLPSNALLAANENAALVSVSCPAAADCVAVGTYFGAQSSDSDAEESVIETFNGSTWTAQQAPMPSDVYASEPDVVLDSVSCSSATACVAVGEYIGSNAGFDPYVAVLSGGSWTWEAASTPTEVSNPSFRLGGNLVQVSCATDGTCVAAGVYHPTSQSQPLIEVPTAGGDWTGTAGPLPEDADSSGSLNNYLTSVSCASATDCAAVGGYVSGGAEYGLGETWTGTIWSASRLQPTADLGDDYSVSCAGSACAATGDYNTTHSVIQTASGGSWTGEIATTLPTTNTGSAKLNAIACASSNSCVGVGGYYSAGSDYDGLIDSGAGSSYTATAAPLPNDANSSNPDIDLKADSCTASGSCVAVGSYTDQSSNYDSLLETGSASAGGWTAEAPPTPASGSDSEFSAVSCVASYGCVAVGMYTTADSGSAGEFAVTPL